MHCGVCGATATSRWALKAHITVEHVGYIAYECVLCPMIFLPTKTYVWRHYQRKHPGQLPRTKHTYDVQKSEELKRLLEESVRSSSECATNSVSENSAQPFVARRPAKAELHRTDTFDTTTTLDDTPVKPPDDLGSLFDLKDIMSAALLQSAPEVAQTVNNSQPTPLPNETFVLDQPTLTRSHSMSTRRSASVAVHARTPRKCKQRRKRQPTPDDGSNTTTNNATTDGVTLTPSADAETGEDGGDAALATLGAGTHELCRLCLTPVRRNRKYKHIWGVHMSRARYQCGACGYASAVLVSVKDHMRRRHRDDGQPDDDYRDLSGEMHDEYMGQRRRAFPRTAGDADDDGTEATDGDTTADDDAAKTPAQTRSSHKTPTTRGSSRCASVTPASTATKSSGRRSRVGGAHRPFCALCQLTIPEGGNAHVDHIWRVHTAQRRFHCVECGAQKVRCDQMRRHVRAAHPTEGTAGGGAETAAAAVDTRFVDFMDDETHRAEFVALRRRAYGDWEQQTLRQKGGAERVAFEDISMQ